MSILERFEPLLNLFYANKKKDWLSKWKNSKEFKFLKSYFFLVLVINIVSYYKPKIFNLFMKIYYATCVFKNLKLKIA